jgi:hypothetical protein
MINIMRNHHLKVDRSGVKSQTVETFATAIHFREDLRVDSGAFGSYNFLSLEPYFFVYFIPVNSCYR